MKVALIPPRGLENYVLQSRFHLALAIPVLMRHKVYVDTYKRAARLGDYVILDNGLAEGMPAAAETIIEVAKTMQAKEVVLPDAMRSTTQTLNLSRAFLANNPTLLGSGARLMGVTQGETWQDLLRAVAGFAEMPAVGTLGIPRHLLTTTDRSAIRIDLANWIADNFPGRFKLHLLGTNVTWLAEVYCVKKYAPHVRSVDSSLPFNYALLGRKLEPTGQTVQRPEKYFEEDWSQRVDRALLKDNIDTFMNWAGANDPEASSGKLQPMSAA